MSLLLAIAAELFLPVFHRWGMKVYIPLMAAAQVVIFMGTWWVEAQRISNVSYWFEGNELHVLPFGWTIHATFGTVVLAAAIAGLLLSSLKGQRLQFFPKTSILTRFDRSTRWVVGVTQGVEQVLLYSVK